MSNPADSPAGGEVAIPVTAEASWLHRLGIPNPQRLIYLGELVRELVMRDIKLRYKRTLLGVAWSLVSPLSQWLVLAFVFRQVLQIQVEHYLSFLFTGILVWSWFQTSLSASATCVLDNAPLLRRPGFPAPILPVVAVSANLVHFCLSLPVLMLGASFDGKPFSIGLLGLPIVVALQFILTLGIGYFLATLHVAYRDTRHLLDVALLLAFYLTPVFYDARFIPKPYDLPYHLNPMVHLLAAYRDIFVSGSLPDLSDLVVVGAFASVLFALGYTRYRRLDHTFAEEL